LIKLTLELGEAAMTFNSKVAIGELPR